MKNLLIIAFLLILPLTANAKIGGFVKGISETDKLELSSLVVDNISIDGIRLYCLCYFSFSCKCLPI